MVRSTTPQQWLCTFVNERVGNDTPMKKPKSTPIKLVRIILVLSEGFILAILLPPEGMYSWVRKNLQLLTWVWGMWWGWGKSLQWSQNLALQVKELLRSGARTCVKDFPCYPQSSKQVFTTRWTALQMQARSEFAEKLPRCLGLHPNMKILSKR